MTGWGPFDITGKNVIVTGAALGIGFGIAKRFVEGGANVLIADIDGDAARAAVDKLTPLGPGKAAFVAVDVTADDAGATLVQECKRHFGSIDVLVNNAGIYPQQPMLEMSPELFDRVYRINLRGLAFVSQAVAKALVEQGTGGKIVNIASVDALHPSMVGLAAYDASKGGVLMFTRNFALELAPHGIQVNAIAPGGIDTEGTRAPLEGSGMTEEQFAAMKQGFIDDKIPVHRYGEPDDIAKVAVFLASPGSDYMTGSLVVVDGGMLLT